MLNKSSYVFFLFGRCGRRIMKFDRGFNLVLGISLFAGILTMAVSYLLSKGNTRLSMTLCVVVSVSIFSLYYLLTSVGDLFTSSLFGMGREVDALAMEAESLEEIKKAEDMKRRLSITRNSFIPRGTSYLKRLLIKSADCMKKSFFNLETLSIGIARR